MVPIGTTDICANSLFEPVIYLPFSPPADLSFGRIHIPVHSRALLCLTRHGKGHREGFGQGEGRGGGGTGSSVCAGVACHRVFAAGDVVRCHQTLRSRHSGESLHNTHVHVRGITGLRRRCGCHDVVWLWLSRVRESSLTNASRTLPFRFTSIDATTHHDTIVGPQPVSDVLSPKWQLQQAWSVE